MRVVKTTTVRYYDHLGHHFKVEEMKVGGYWVERVDEDGHTTLVMGLMDTVQEAVAMLDQYVLTLVPMPHPKNGN